MSSESERTERLIDIVRTAGLLSANVPPIIDRLRGPDCHWQADRADGPGLRLRLKHWDREIQRLWSMIPLELPELAQRLKHVGKPGPWAPDDRSIDWGGAADEWRSVEVEARRLLAEGNLERSPAVDDRDIAILKQLGKLPDRVFVAIEIAAMSDRTAKKRLKGLITQGLVTRPPGKTRGVRITSQGLELLSRLP